MPTHQELPEQFGRYRILSKLGAGGMGAVYLAEDGKLGRKVALKVSHFKLGDGEAVLERFRREARLAACQSVQLRRLPRRPVRSAPLVKVKSVTSNEEDFAPSRNNAPEEGGINHAAKEN